MSTNENLAPAVSARLAKELRDLLKNPIEGITLSIQDDNMAEIGATLVGPVDTPFEGGEFRMKLVLSADFPREPPKGYFITKIFHPNVSTNGDICVNTLKRDWKSDLGLRHVLMVVRCLLIEPNPDSALNEEAGKLLQEQYEEYSKHAKMMTEIYAKPSGTATDAGTGADKNAVVKKKIAKKSDKRKTLKRL